MLNAECLIRLGSLMQLVLEHIKEKQMKKTQDETPIAMLCCAMLFWKDIKIQEWGNPTMRSLARLLACLVQRWMLMLAVQWYW